MAGSTGGGDTGVLGGLGSLLGLLGLGRTSGLFGGGIGTPAGATAVGNRAADRADPWAQYRDQFAKQITPDFVNSLLDPTGAQMKNDPGYKFALSQGIGAINAGDAAQGTLRSGNRGVELAQFGEGLASQYQKQYFDEGMSKLGMFANLGGVNSSSPAEAGRDIISGFTGATNLQNSGLNGLFGGAGASGGFGGLLNGLGGLGSAISGGLSGIGNFITNLFSGGNDTGIGGGDDPGGTLTSDILNSITSGGGGGVDLGGWSDIPIP